MRDNEIMTDDLKDRSYLLNDGVISFSGSQEDAVHFKFQQVFPESSTQKEVNNGVSDTLYRLRSAFIAYG